MSETMTDAVWYPFTSMKGYEPVHIDRANACTLYGSNGQTYLDAISSWWVNIHGHANPVIAKAIAEQAATMEHIIFAGFTHTPALQLAKRLREVLPGNMNKLFFSDNGSTAVEVGIKMALQYAYNLGKPKTRIIAFENAYHGDTFGAMSTGARGAFNAPFEQHLFRTEYIATPTKENIAAVKKTVAKLTEKGDVAAFIFEPLVQGAGGMLMHEAGHLDEILRIMKKNNVICIADEVMTGFGRTGRNFACEYLSASPDIICVSKGITGGFMPLGVTACNSEIVAAFDTADKSKTFYHGHSYTANPMSCAAANASLDILLSEACQSNIRRIEHQHRIFSNIIRNEPMIENIRQTGTILAMDIATGEDTSYFNSIRDHFYTFCLNRGVLLRPLGNTIYIMPPYVITDHELQKIYEVILQFITYYKNQ